MIRPSTKLWLLSSRFEDVQRSVVQFSAWFHNNGRILYLASDPDVGLLGGLKWRICMKMKVFGIVLLPMQSRLHLDTGQ